MEDQKNLFEINVEEGTARELTELSRWTKLFGILVISLVVLMTLFFLFAWDKMERAFMVETGEESMVLAATMAIIGCIIIIIVGLMMFFLVRSANRVRKGIYGHDQLLFNSGLGDLKTYFAFMGVFGILSLLFNLISLIG